MNINCIIILGLVLVVSLLCSATGQEYPARDTDRRSWRYEGEDGWMPGGRRALEGADGQGWTGGWSSPMEKRFFRYTGGASMAATGARDTQADKMIMYNKLNRLRKLFHRSTRNTEDIQQ